VGRDKDRALILAHLLEQAFEVPFAERAGGLGMIRGERTLELLERE
jgi:hypothetical protein